MSCAQIRSGRPSKLKVTSTHVSPAVSDGAQHATPSSTTQTQCLINSSQIFGSLFFPLGILFLSSSKKKKDIQEYLIR